MWQANGTNLSYVKSYDLKFNYTGSRPALAPASERRHRHCAAGSAGRLFVANTTDNNIYIFNKSTLTAYTMPSLSGTVAGLEHSGVHCHGPRRQSLGDLQKHQHGAVAILHYTTFGATPTLAAR